MKTIRRILCVALVAMFLCACALPAFAASTRTFYLGGKGVTRYGYVDLEGLAAGDKVTDVKSSNKKIFKVAFFNENNDETTDFADEEDDQEEETRNSYNAQASIKLLKKGKANLTYKVNGKKKSLPIKVLAYKNPVKSFVLSSFSNKNLKSQFNKTSVAKTKVKYTHGGYLKVTAASGWKITSAQFVDLKGSQSRGLQTYGAPVSSIQLYIPITDVGRAYEINVSFQNTANGATMDITYSMTKK